jgi:defect-in-organelle-trafficking protein DotC
MRFFIVLLVLLLPPNSFAGEQPKKLTEIIQKRGNSKTKISEEIASQRINAIRNVAYSLGIQSAAKWRYEQIEKVLESKKQNLNRIYSFDLLLLGNNVLPPVIIESSGSFLVEDKIAVKTDKSFKIIKEARIVSNPPSWRDYLLQEFEVKPVDSILYPRTDEEIDVWESTVKKGWALGVRQADRVFSINLRKLTRDMRGMILFSFLSGQGLVSLPQVATDTYAIRVGKTTLDLGQKSFKLVVPSHFQGEEKWKPFQMSP